MSLTEAKHVAGRWPQGWDSANVATACFDLKPRIVVLSTLWYPEVINGLKESLNKFFSDLLREDWKRHINYLEFQVPGSFEMPLAAKLAFDGKLSGMKSEADIVIALGCVIKGETPHFDFVCSAVSNGLTQVQLEKNRALGFGVLTVNNIQEAMARTGKGREAAQAALSLWLLTKKD